MTPEMVRQRQYEDYERYQRAQLRGEAVDALGTIAVTALVGIAPPETSTPPSAEFISEPSPQIVRPLGSAGLRKLVMLEPHDNPLDHPEQVLYGSRENLELAA